MNPEPNDDLRRAAFVFLLGLGALALLLTLLAEVGR